MTGFDPYPTQDYSKSPDLNPAPPRAADGALDPQPIGMLQSSTIVTLLTCVGAGAVALGFKWTATDAQIQKIADGVIALLLIVVPLIGVIARMRAASIVKAGAKAPPAVVAVAKLRRDAVKSGDPFARAPGSSTQRGGRAAPCLGLALIAASIMYGVSGCGAFNPNGSATTQPATMSPIVRVYVARQVYTNALPALTTAIDAGLFDSSPDVLRSIAASRKVFENALDQAEIYATQGRAADFEFWMGRVDSALSEFLKLATPRAGNRAIPIPRPATRPAAYYPADLTEVLWTPSRSRRYLRPSQNWAAPSPGRSQLLSLDNPCPTIRNPRSSPRNGWRNSRTIARSATH